MVFTGAKKGYNRACKGIPALKKIFIIIMAVTAFGFSGRALADEVSVVKAEGTAIRLGDEALIKRAAIDKALKGAVAAALEPILKKEAVQSGTDILEQAIFANPRAFILNYKILSEGWITHMEPVSGVLESPSPQLQQDSATAGLELFHIWIEASIDARQLRGAVGKLSGGNQTIIPVKITILNVTDYNAYRALISALKSITPVRDIAYSSFYRGKILLTAKVSTDTQTLIERIGREAGDGYIVIPGGAQSIIIKPAERPGGIE